jgi:hypothetical protein
MGLIIIQEHDKNSIWIFPFESCLTTPVNIYSPSLPSFVRLHRRDSFAPKRLRPGWKSVTSDEIPKFSKGKGVESFWARDRCLNQLKTEEVES